MRIILIGDKSVGKTCLTQRYLKNHYNEENLGTLGVSQGMKLITLNGHRIRLTVYDTAGAE
jgi:small GTP-binding protein